MRTFTLSFAFALLLALTARADAPSRQPVFIDPFGSEAKVPMAALPFDEQQRMFDSALDGIDKITASLQKNSELVEGANDRLRDIRSDNLSMIRVAVTWCQSQRDEQLVRIWFDDVIVYDITNITDPVLWQTLKTLFQPKFDELIWADNRFTAAVAAFNDSAQKLEKKEK